MKQFLYSLSFLAMIQHYIAAAESAVPDEALAGIDAIASRAEAASSQPNGPYQKGDVLVVQPGVNLRKGYSHDAPIIRKTSTQEAVIVDGVEMEGFVQVRTQDGNPAWVYKSLTKPLTQTIMNEKQE